MAGRCCGQLDVDLSPAGRLQAERLAGELGAVPLATVYSSPLQRALRTALPVAVAHGLRPVVLTALAEIDFGELEGLRYEEIERRYPDVWREWAERPFSVRFPGGEDWRSLRVRVLDAVAALARRHEGETVAVVAHGGVLRVLLAASGFDDVFRMPLPYASVTWAEWREPYTAAATQPASGR